jgi:hypothetical protein
LPLSSSLLRRVREQDAAGRLFLGLGRLDHDAVIERLQGQLRSFYFLGHWWLPVAYW